jgi:hypothetical protein
VKLVRDETADEVGERVEVVEPDAPEARNAGRRDGDTYEREGKKSQSGQRGKGEERRKVPQKREKTTRRKGLVIAAA